MSEMISPYRMVRDPNAAPPSSDGDAPLYDATFGQAVSRFFRRYATFTGRASRSEYWWAYLFQSIVGMAVGLVVTVVVVIVVIASLVDDPSEANAVSTAIWATVWTLVAIYASTLPLLVPSIAVTVRRLHDTNRSGLWCLLMLVPYGSWAIFVFSLLEPNPAGAQYDRSPVR